MLKELIFIVFCLILDVGWLLFAYVSMTILQDDSFRVLVNLGY